MKVKPTRNWRTMPRQVAAPEASTLTVRNLTPFLEYALRLVANNVVGASPPSEPTKRFQTIQAPPSHAPHNVTVRAVSATQLRVRWTVRTLPLPRPLTSFFFFHLNEAVPSFTGFFLCWFLLKRLSSVTTACLPSFTEFFLRLIWLAWLSQSFAQLT